MPGAVVPACRLYHTARYGSDDDRECLSPAGVFPHGSLFSAIAGVGSKAEQRLAPEHLKNIAIPVGVYSLGYLPYSPHAVQPARPSVWSIVSVRQAPQDRVR